MLKSHLKLIEDIKSEERSLSSLSKKEFESVYEASLASNDFTVFRMITNHNTGIYDYDDRVPSWLDSEFEAPIWKLTLLDTPKFIRWNTVILDDGEKLTAPKHAKLLNAFKYWITATANPLENSGKVELASKTILTKVYYVIRLINAILLNAKELLLAKYQLSFVDTNFWLTIFTQMATYGATEGVYRFEERIKKLVDNGTKTISDEECEKFVAQYPYLNSTLASEDIYINPNNRQKASAWLFKQGYYRTYQNIPKYNGNGAVLGSLVLGGKCLSDDIRISNFVEFHLKPQSITTEYKPINNKDNSRGMNSSSLRQYISVLKLIHTNLDRQDACTPNIIPDTLTVETINDIKGVRLKKTKRTRTLSPSFVFNLIDQSYTFTKENQDEILEQCLTALIEGKGKSSDSDSNKLKPQRHQKSYNEKIHGEMSSSERNHWFDTDAINCVSSEWLKKGIKQVNAFELNTPNRHQRIRNNESLFDLFCVLQGSIQFLVGAIMARRQDELIDLKPYGNLVPNKNPFTSGEKECIVEKGEDGLIAPKYSLQFKLKKSGNKGENQTITRPIPTSIAKFIWKLEEFNRKAEDSGLNKGKLSLFNYLQSKSCSLSKVIPISFDGHYNALCDYLETDLVLMDNGEYRRNYIRQHQLRRFFALVFFWSKKKESLDALRWMLGHTDMEHLYHYISESETGEVLNGAKASVLASSVIDKTANELDTEQLRTLRKLLATRLTGNENAEVMINSLSNTADDFYEDDYETVPHISQIEKQQVIENEILQLLDDETISLEPEFFSVTNSEGSTEKTFNLVLTFNEKN
ncbi:integrase [Vibrio sp. NH-7]